MTVGLPIGNTNLFTAGVTNRTITPYGPIPINDGRQRSPAANAAVTLTGSSDGAQYDVYAVQAPPNQYTLMVQPLGTNMSARRDIVAVGTATDYPSRNTCRFFARVGGAVDSFMRSDVDGIHFRNANPQYGWTTVRWDDPLGVQFLFSQGVQQLIFDQWGHLIVNNVSGAPSVAVGIGAGTGGSATITGGDQAGKINIKTGNSPVVGGIVATINFSHPFSIPPGSAYTYPTIVLITPADQATAALSTSLVYATVLSASQWQMQSGVSALPPTGNYTWNYFVL